MKMRCKALLCAVLALSLIAAAGAAVQAGQFKSMTIQVGSATPKGPNDGYCNLIEAISERLEKWTDGAVKLEYLGSGQLGNDAELAEAIKLGTVDGAIITSAAIASSVNSIGAFDMPFLFSKREALFDLIDNSDACKKIEAKILDGINGRVLSWAFNGYRNVLNNIRPIKSAADFAGMKIRVMESPVYMQLFRLLGANPTPMSISECITGLEQGTVDGMDHPISAAVSEGTYKLVKYYDLTNHTCTVAFFVLNKVVLDAMSPELRDLFVKAGREARQVQRDKLREREEGLLKVIADSGVKVGRDIDLKSIQEKVMPMWKDYRKNLDPEIFDQVLKHLGIELK